MDSGPRQTPPAATRPAPSVYASRQGRSISCCILRSAMRSAVTNVSPLIAAQSMPSPKPWVRPALPSAWRRHTSVGGEGTQVQWQGHRLPVTLNWLIHHTFFLPDVESAPYQASRQRPVVQQQSDEPALISFAAGTAAFASIQPIPGSITYDNSNVMLEKAPAGSTFFHTFSNGDGRDVREIYKVNADKSVTLVNRTVSNAS
eukprot:gene24945-28202_t